MSYENRTNATGDTWAEDLTASFMAGIKRGREGADEQILSLQTQVADLRDELASVLEGIHERAAETDYALVKRIAELRGQA